MARYICYGDIVHLFCEDSNAHNSLQTFYQQKKEDYIDIKDIPDSQAITFEICPRNRYKLNKIYRQTQSSKKRLADGVSIEKLRSDALSETRDNEKEKQRAHGQRLRYGQIIQLKHIFTDNYVHISTSKTSLRDKNCMQVMLYGFDDKHAQFKILPRFKVKSEGDLIQDSDQVLLESVKSPGQFLHASTAFQDTFIRSKICEINLGVSKTGFVIGLFKRPSDNNSSVITGGSLVRLFHKELEAYVVSDGLYMNPIPGSKPDQVHMRLRPIDNSKPKTMFPSTSAITYWQVEHKNGLQYGSEILWEHSIRFRHLPTKMYLALDNLFNGLILVPSPTPSTVFILYPVTQEKDEAEFESYARIKHAVSGKWLHALKDKFIKPEDKLAVDEIGKLQWDGADLRKLGVEQVRMDDDAFTLQKVSDSSKKDFNIASGFAPVLISFIETISQHPQTNIPVAIIYDIKQTLIQMKNFMIVNALPDKKRQKLMRNLHLLDLIVYFFQMIFKPTFIHLYRINEKKINDVLSSMLEVLLYYLKGDSRKNELYFAKYIMFFENLENGQIDRNISNNALDMIAELIRDNRKIVERISKETICEIVDKVQATKNYRYLEYLNVISVCDGIPLPENQSFIVDQWLQNEDGVFLTELATNIPSKKNENIVYVKTGEAKDWVKLSDFVKVTHDSNQYMFLEKQLELFGKLCEGRNHHAIEVITKSRRFLTWEEAFVCLTDPAMPAELRAKYCNLIIKLFVDVGNNTSVVEQTKLTFVYNEVVSDSADIMKKYLDNLERLSDNERQIIQSLQGWIASFLKEHGSMSFDDIGGNNLIEQVLELVKYLIKFGFYDASDIKKLREGLMDLMDGTNDRPPKSVGKDKEAKLAYQKQERYKPCAQTNAIVQAKLAAMDVVDVLLTFQFSIRLEKFIALFRRLKKQKSNRLSSMLESKRINRKDQHLKADILEEIERIMESTTVFDKEDFRDIMLDLSKYEYDDMITKSMHLLTKFFTAKADLFEKAVKAQVLLTDDSIQINQIIDGILPKLRRNAGSKMSNEQADESVAIIKQLIDMCHLVNDCEEHHTMNQIILANNGVMDIVLKILQHNVQMEENHHGALRDVFRWALKLLKAMIKGNEEGQAFIFQRLDFMLRIKGVEKELAEALTEVFVGNQTTCLKVNPLHIQKIVDLTAKYQEKAAEYLDALSAIIKIEELNLPLKRNQDYVVKYLNQRFSRAAYVFDKYEESERLQILMGKMGKQHLSYLMSLVDILATCCEGENRFIESLCQTILPFRELISVVTNEQVDTNLKRPFVRYLLWAYLNTGGSFSETEFASGDYDGEIEEWFRSIISTMTRLIPYVSSNKNSTKQLLKKAPSTSAVLTRLVRVGLIYSKINHKSINQINQSNQSSQCYKDYRFMLNNNDDDDDDDDDDYDDYDYYL
ncbi:DgyrCDS6509 [Dimorphilus gyrociliatus]|uniref:Inositol 1,4,5-trisphosphate receptor n=1 Tax=Dimorphilus gyrociliatus TaxID=2664684 RepID=A0A7I8VR16_9ANNE|nr:DgyrCDS6509 [Dimorphilus gyrociliatus]